MVRQIFTKMVSKDAHDLKVKSQQTSWSKKFLHCQAATKNVEGVHSTVWPLQKSQDNSCILGHYSNNKKKGGGVIHYSFPVILHSCVVVFCVLLKLKSETETHVVCSQVETM